MRRSRRGAVSLRTRVNRAPSARDAPPSVRPRLSKGPRARRSRTDAHTPIKEFFAAVACSVKGFLNAEELFRSIVTALGSGSFLGIALTVAQALLAHVATIFPNPVVSALATMLLTLVVDLLRRLNQGDKAAPAPAPAAKA